jgi:hypothetical protein
MKTLLDQENLENLSNNQLDLMQITCFKILEKISSGKDLHYFEKKASKLIGKINKIKAKRLFNN